MKPRQDQDQVTAAVTSAVATLAPAVKAGVFDGRPTLLSFKKMVMKQAMGWRFEKLDGEAKMVMEQAMSRRSEKLDADACQLLVYQYDDDRADTVIEKALAGDAIADTLLREVASEKLQAREALLPPNLTRYIVSNVLADPDRPKNPGRPPGHFDRDAWVYLVVSDTLKRGFRLARNATTKSESASSIVTAALSELGVTMSEKSVARIWRDMHPDLSRLESEQPLP
jgi:hypothetical protein